MLYNEDAVGLENVLLCNSRTCMLRQALYRYILYSLSNRFLVFDNGFQDLQGSIYEFALRILIFIDYYQRISKTS